MTDVAGFVTRLHNDKAFRERFAANPAEVLREAGLDPSVLALPDKIDPNALANRVQNLFAGDTGAVPSSKDLNVDKPSAQELWDRFGAIGFKPSAMTWPWGDDPTPAIVIYGVSVVTSAVAVVGSHPVMSVDQMAAMRKLSGHAPEQLTFAVTGPDGTKVDGLSRPAVKAFLDRLK